MVTRHCHLALIPPAPSPAAPPRHLPSAQLRATAPSCTALPPPPPSTPHCCRPTCRPPHHVPCYAIHRVSTIALALGPQHAREELVPFLQDSMDDEDEVLLALAQKLGRNFKEYIVGKEYAPCKTQWMMRMRSCWPWRRSWEGILRSISGGKSMRICYWVLWKSCRLWKRPLYEIRCM